MLVVLKNTTSLLFFKEENIVTKEIFEGKDDDFITEVLFSFIHHEKNYYIHVGTFYLYKDHVEYSIADVGDNYISLKRKIV
jgi:hypothetical protein